MTTSRNLQKSQTGVREACRLHQQLAPGTSLLVHASNSTMHGRPTITTAEETLRHATGSHLCLHNRSKRSSTLSRWYALLSYVYSVLTLLILPLGDGSPRVVQTSHTFLLMIMHPLLGHGVLANTFQPQHLGIGAHSIYELTVSSSSIFWLRRICPFLS